MSPEFRKGDDGTEKPNHRRESFDPDLLRFNFNPDENDDTCEAPTLTYDGVKNSNDGEAPTA